MRCTPEKTLISSPLKLARGTEVTTLRLSFRFEMFLCIFLCHLPIQGPATDVAVQLHLSMNRIICTPRLYVAVVFVLTRLSSTSISTTGTSSLGSLDQLHRSSRHSGSRCDEEVLVSMHIYRIYLRRKRSNKEPLGTDQDLIWDAVSGSVR